MTSDDQVKKCALAIRANSTEAERLKIEKWLEGLIEIAKNKDSNISKSRSALELTLISNVAWPAIKLIAIQLKRHAWDDRKVATRMAGIGAVAGVIAFGNAGAGIAALGTAVGVPLWIVTGAGAAFAGVLLEELKRN